MKPFFVTSSAATTFFPVLIKATFNSGSFELFQAARKPELSTHNLLAAT